MTTTVGILAVVVTVLVLLILVVALFAGVVTYMFAPVDETEDDEE